jgi:tRNA A-37 threonylcarbamoyl transferase component Bud32
LVSRFPEYAARLHDFREADHLIKSAETSSGSSTARFGGYDLLEEVGRGGMGIVYRARERKLDRIVALKQVRAAALADDDAIQQCLKEAKAVSRLNHPNIVQIFRVSDSGDEPFIALEFVEGPTLAGRIGGTPLAPRLVGTIGAAVTRAIQHAHEHGIVHRDLKPANILLSGPPDNPVPKVTDFGAAKELAHANDAAGTRFLGTPSYMAPEQVESKWGPVSERTDVYGIGAVLYEALTGRPPFCADSIGETLRQVTESQPVNPRLLNPAIPRDLETICLKSLQKSPLRRYASAAAVADDLERFLSGKPILARPVGPLARAWMWCRREPTVAGLTAILLLVLLGGVTGIALQWRRADMARRSAEINAAESHELLVELIRLNRVDPWRQSAPISATHDSLLRAEAHCRKLLEKNPNAINLRLALMNIYVRLTTLAGPLGKTDELRIKLQQARSLWEPLADYAAGNPEIQDMLASAE